MSNNIQDTGHWEFFRDFVPEEWAGFVYRITDLDTGRMYIGKKFLAKTTRKIVKGRKNRKRITKQSDWKKYTGSSKWLNKEIEKRGKERFKFVIESLHESKGTLAYSEVQKLVKENVLREALADGTKKYFNGCIPPVKFTPGPETDKEKQYKKKD